jgi:hypothetical protein
LRFADGSKMTLYDVMKEEARPLSDCDHMGIRAFDRSRLRAACLLDFYRACELGPELPEDLFAGGWVVAHPSLARHLDVEPSRSPRLRIRLQKVGLKEGRLLGVPEDLREIRATPVGRSAPRLG